MTINYQQPFSYYPYGYPQQSPFIEQSYIENILRLNKGKIATVYATFVVWPWD